MGRPDLSQKWIRAIMNTFYDNTPTVPGGLFVAEYVGYGQTWSNLPASSYWIWVLVILWALVIGQPLRWRAVGMSPAASPNPS